MERLIPFLGRTTDLGPILDHRLEFTSTEQGGSEFLPDSLLTATVTLPVDRELTSLIETRRSHYPVPIEQHPK